MWVSLAAAPFHLLVVKISLLRLRTEQHVTLCRTKRDGSGLQGSWLDASHMLKDSVGRSRGARPHPGPSS